MQDSSDAKAQSQQGDQTGPHTSSEHMNVTDLSDVFWSFAGTVATLPHEQLVATDTYAANPRLVAFHPMHMISVAHQQYPHEQSNQNMTEIKPNMFLGGYRDAHGDIPGWYMSVRATHVLCVASEISPPQVACILIKHLPIPDDDPSTNIFESMQSAVDFVENALKTGGTVLIHCRSGASRAVCVVLVALVTCYGYTLIDAYHFVSAKREAMNVFPPYLMQLERWYSRFLVATNNTLAVPVNLHEQP